MKKSFVVSDYTLQLQDYEKNSIGYCFAYGDFIAQWSEKDFIARYRAVRVPAEKGSPMPWGVFKRMNDLELKALYRYLKTLKPVDRKIEKTIYEVNESV